MSLILNIDTALDKACICLAENEKPLVHLSNNDQKDHAAWLHSSIARLLNQENYTLNDVAAIAVTIGPGSYTGLRVGLAAAKGFCYALKIPLLAIDTLKLIAFAAKDVAEEWIAPLIDARRMEVFTSLFDRQMTCIKKPFATIINDRSFSEELVDHKILFCGNGATKANTLIKSPHASFTEIKADHSHLASLANAQFVNKEFADIAYVEPFYLKEFYTVQKS
jgi:tRNA threonylcarbamoyladenosine biosynthesis protein TsaB